jgi:hypothetical protein
MALGGPLFNANNRTAGDPKRGDAILKRMLQSKPKPHKDMVAERKGKSGKSK